VGRPAAAEERRDFQQYLDIFLRWNRTYRMTALHSPGAIVHDLFLDSLLFLRVLPVGPIAVVDIGAGAGIPGLPMRLADARIRLTLIEARRKRVSFLRTVCRELGLTDVVVKEGRAEAIARAEPSLAGIFDAAVSRAVGPITALVPVAFEYLRPGGVLIVSGSPGSRAVGQIKAVRVRIPGSRQIRIFLKATKEGNVPRGT
jgi:16S rRNA (guanine527-N7)-methyltransferase